MATMPSDLYVVAANGNPQAITETFADAEAHLRSRGVTSQLVVAGDHTWTYAGNVGTTWTITRTPMTLTFTTKTIAPDDDDTLFEQIEGSVRCTVCGSVDCIRTDEYPSMYAGTESTTTCKICGSWEGDGDPFKGTRRIQRRDGVRLLIAQGDVDTRLIARGGFLYPDVDEHDEANYGTDPATLLDVKVGDRITVTDVRRGLVERTFTVAEVARDQWGMRFWGKQWEGQRPLEPLPYPHACTILNRITRAAA